MPLKDKTKRLEYRKKYRIEHREEIREQQRLYRQNHKQEIKEQKKIYSNTHKEELTKYREVRKNNGVTHQYTIKRNWDLKTKAITHYGNGKCACVRCGFSDIRALTIDHTNNNGAAHRKENNKIQGNHIYGWLIKHNYPEGYQTLCANCQFIKRTVEIKKGESV